MLLWPNTDSPISTNTGDSERLFSWAEKGRAGARERRGRGHDPVPFQISLAHWGGTHRTQWSEAYLLSQVGHRTKGRQRKGPFSATTTPTLLLVNSWMVCPLTTPYATSLPPREGKALTSADGPCCFGTIPTLGHLIPSLTLLPPSGRECLSESGNLHLYVKEVRF